MLAVGVGVSDGVGVGGGYTKTVHEAMLPPLATTTTFVPIVANVTAYVAPLALVDNPPIVYQA